MSVLATFSDSVASTDISSAMYAKVLRTYVLGRVKGGDFEDEPRIMLAKYLYDNWTCPITLSQIGYDQYFTGYGDIVIKFKEEDATIIGGMTGHTDFIEASPYLVPIPYHSRIDIYIEVRANVPDPMPAELNTIKGYIKNFINRRPLGLKDEGIQSMELTSGYYNYPEQRDKNTFKDQVTLMMKYAKVYR
jgi:hypothetical protein